MAKAAGAAKIRVEHLPNGITAKLRYERRGDRETNRIVVGRSLIITRGNVKAAAKLLGVSRNTLNAFRASLGLEPK